MQIKEIKHNTPEYRDELILRDQVLRKPLGLTLTTEETKDEENQYHIGAFIDNKLVGCLVLTPRENHIMKVRQVSVDNNFQKKGIGKAMMQFAENYAKSKGFQHLELNARRPIENFYISLGYNLSGEEFINKGIPHIRMEKHL
jgi:predicted GNAT family N-acyltransferase